MIKAECTWGEGPDVLIVGRKEEGAGGFGYGHRVLLLESVEHSDGLDMCPHWQVDLTAKEAIEFAVELTNAAQQALELDELSRKESY